MIVDGNSMNVIPGKGVAGTIVAGFNFRAFINDWQYAYDNPSTDPQEGGEAYSNYLATQLYGQNELNEIKRWGGNTVRFQVSQYSMTRPETSVEYQRYKTCLVNAVRLARNSGLLVMLAAQYQMNPALSGTGRPFNMPTAETRDFWTRINGLFPDPSARGDDGIIFELWNEPGLEVYKADPPAAGAPFELRLKSNVDKLWRAWRNGTNDGPVTLAEEAGRADTSIPQGIVGMQQLVGYLRATLGSTRVLSIEGLQLGKTFEGMLANTMNPVSDPLGRLIYAVHPYPKGFAEMPSSTTAAASAAQYAMYDRRWGYLKQGVPNRMPGVPVLTTEWFAGTSEEADGPGLQALPNYRVAYDLINYSRINQIPLVASAFDVKTNMIRALDWKPDNTLWKRTTFNCFDQFRLTRLGSNVGQLVYRFFQNGYASTVTYGTVQSTNWSNGERDPATGQICPQPQD